MPVALHSYKVDDDGEIRVEHIFYAASEEAAESLMKQHAAGCAAFGPAVAADKTIDVFEDIDEDELPDADDLESDVAEEDDDPDDDGDQPAEEDDEE